MQNILVYSHNCQQSSDRLDISLFGTRRQLHGEAQGKDQVIFAFQEAGTNADHGLQHDLLESSLKHADIGNLLGDHAFSGKMFLTNPSRGLGDTKSNSCSLATLHYIHNPKPRQGIVGGLIRIESGKGYGRSALCTTDSKSCTFVNVHLTSGNPGRAKDELTMILNHINKKPAIVVGDFNLGRSSISEALGLPSNPINIRSAPRRYGPVVDYCAALNFPNGTTVNLLRSIQQGSDHNRNVFTVSIP